jgi:hypothetical protein
VNLRIDADLDGTGAFLNISTASFLKVDSGDKIERFQPSYGQTIYGKSIPSEGLKQSDFVKSIINMLNLYIITNPNNEFDLIFTPYPDFYSDTTLDWSDKKSLSKGVSIKPPSEWTPKSYSFKYKKNTDYLSTEYFNKYGTAYGSYLHTTGNEFAKDDNAFELAFALVPSQTRGTSNRILPAMYQLNEDGLFKKERKEYTIAFFFGRKTSSATYTVTGTGVTIPATADFGLASHVYDPYTSEDGTLWDLSFTVPSEIYYTSTAFYPTLDLFSKYYQGYVTAKSSKDAKLVTLYLLLKPSDTQALDFRKLIKIDSGLYYLNKVDGYNPLGNELTKVELLRLV